MIETVCTQLDALMPLIKECLEAGKSVHFSPKGTSMMPMLRPEKDSVILSPAPQRLKKYDLPLYRRNNGMYVLHRIVKVKDTYTCMGDHQFVEEKGIEHRQIIGVVIAFYRDGKRHCVRGLGYRLYCLFWYHSRGIRRFFVRARNFLRRCLHKKSS